MGEYILGIVLGIILSCWILFCSIIAWIHHPFMMIGTVLVCFWMSRYKKTGKVPPEVIMITYSVWAMCFALIEMF